MTTLVAGQIVFLECCETRLYAEMIQVLAPRQIGWIRPLALVSAAEVQILGAAMATVPTAAPMVPDMLWPLSQLQPALDIDVIPLLNAPPTKASTDKTANVSAVAPIALTVQEFVQRLWVEDPPAVARRSAVNDSDED